MNKKGTGSLILRGSTCGFVSETAAESTVNRRKAPQKL